MKITLATFLLLISVIAHAQKSEDLPTVSYVEVERYIGKWYAVSALPQFFTRHCLAQTAEYKVMTPQSVSVLNTCLKKKGKTTIKGQAVVANSATNAELIVTFDNFFTRLFRVKGDYNIIKLDKDYRFVLVGSKDRKSLWIMSRSPEMPEATYASFVETAKELGFPVKKLIRSRF